jgi:hypothetical protein
MHHMVQKCMIPSPACSLTLQCITQRSALQKKDMIPQRKLTCNSYALGGHMVSAVHHAERSMTQRDEKGCEPAEKVNLWNLCPG